MDIAALSMDISTSRILNQVSLAVLDNSMEQSEVMADGMIKALEASVTPHLGQNIDVLV